MTRKYGVGTSFPEVSIHWVLLVARKCHPDSGVRETASKSGSTLIEHDGSSDEVGAPFARAEGCRNARGMRATSVQRSISTLTADSGYSSPAVLR